MTLVLYYNAKHKTMDNLTVNKVFGEAFKQNRRPHTIMSSLMTVKTIGVRYLFVAVFFFIP
jgi:hypothetical protein